jgi:lipopolysaccharide/colanic/teichoic acid biosynthesis glycosyltransferase
MSKRIFDMLLVGIASPLVLLLVLALAFSVRLRMGSPILFVQTRTGLGGKLFRMYKFRTMTETVDSCGARLSDAERLTPFGRWLRATSLDELPEFFNVLKGDMSLVGPRPLLPEYLPLYSHEQFRRHEVRPGITGWAQINGRNAVTWERKFELDVWYVDNQSMWLDIKILFYTVKKVVSRDGVSFQGDATMPRFTGSK